MNAGGEDQDLEALQEEDEDVPAEGSAALPPGSARHRHSLTTATAPTALQKQLEGRS